jgi:partner of Y14 and mago protein
MQPFSCSSLESVRKQIKIRPGFTPQEDVRRFRSAKQVQMDANALPKGHIIGWAPPPQSTAASGSAEKPMSKSAKKNAKRREKKEEKKEDVPDNWDDDEDEGAGSVASNPKSTVDSGATTGQSTKTSLVNGQKQDTPNRAAAPEPDPASAVGASPAVDALTSKVDKLKVK